MQRDHIFTAAMTNVSTGTWSVRKPWLAQWTASARRLSHRLWAESAHQLRCHHLSDWPLHSA
ncbi:MAG: hypothetical protein AVDCRST_MAG43-894 [uncultured Thermomicrobiales bacterium]|uniref:Uncharacterized protein n=1 Tax=uncultured Thermomicrobiales bacterium TaxID=1645740 RepID=A0A6J4UF61_9BACT|nr:MAG: hypothetical protein AVDCRST_MAG43-894 [uncultured Thermomicrobiales bacterium]